MVVNHSLYFKDPQTGACTNKIERIWRCAKEGVPRYGRRGYFFEGYLATSAFKKRFPTNAGRFHAFLNELARDYPVVERPQWEY